LYSKATADGDGKVSWETKQNGGKMKSLFILASVMVVLFLAAPNNVEAQNFNKYHTPTIHGRNLLGEN